MARDVVLGLKLIHLDRKAFQHRHGFDLVRLCAPAVDELVADGLVTVTDERVSLTRKGILWGDFSGRKLAAAVDAIAC
jgi:oxygen-independent coproporphyrinogen-3 oxidase